MRTTGHLDKAPSTADRSRAAGGHVGAQLGLGDAIQATIQATQNGLAPPGHASADLDRELVVFVARLGAVSIGHVEAAMGVGRTAAYRRVAALVDGGLLERLAPLRGEPALIRATRTGLRYVGLDALPVARVTAAGAVHWLRCATVALHLEEELGERAGHLLAERELVLAERIEGRQLASARLSSHGREGFHRPDLAMVTAAGVIAVEVELSAKAPRRLEAIVRAWRRAGQVGEVRYYCPPGTVRRGVERR